MANTVREVRKFAALLAMLEDGRFDAELSSDLHELNEALARRAEETGKAKGELSLKFKFSTDSSGVTQIEVDHNMKKPKPLRSRTVLWMSGQNRAPFPIRRVARLIMALAGIGEIAYATYDVLDLPVVAFLSVVQAFVGGLLALADLLERAGYPVGLVRIHTWSRAMQGEAYLWAIAFVEGREDLPAPDFVQEGSRAA